VSFSDGFFFWLGKAAAEVVVGIGIMAVFGIFCLLFVLWKR